MNLDMVGANVTIASFQTPDDCTFVPLENMAANEMVMDHDYTLDSLDKVSKLIEDNKSLKAQVLDLKKELHVTKFKLKLIQSKNSTVGKSFRKKAVKEVLGGKFSEASLDMMMSDKPRFRSKKWSEKDYSDAMELKCISTRALEFIRKK